MTLLKQRTPLTKVLFILDELKKGGTKKATPEKISGYALEKYEVDLPTKVIISCINRAKKGLVKKYRAGDGNLELEVLEEGRRVLSDFKESNGGSVGILQERGLHPKIIEVSGPLFKDGHFPQAIFEAYKEINNRVKRMSGYNDKDGKDLMAQAFKPDYPKIKISPLQTRSDKDEQEGFMHIFMGVMLGIRNPKAHERVVNVDQQKTIEYLTLASLLMRKLDEST